MPERLAAFGLGILHATLLLLLVVVLLLLGDDAGALAGIGTLPGIALGAWLAGVSWAATALALRGQDLRAPVFGQIVGRAAVAGFGAGAAFFGGALLGIGLIAGEGGTIVVALVGAPFAGAGGLIVATALALVDVALFVLARRLLTASSA